MERQGGRDAALTVSDDRVEGRHNGGRRLKAAPREDEDGGGGHALTYGSSCFGSTRPCSESRAWGRRCRGQMGSMVTVRSFEGKSR
jgi:hypothetical protein